MGGFWAVNRKKFLKIAFIILCVSVYIGRVYYVNHNAKGLRDYREIHMGEWSDIYRGKILIKNAKFVKKGEKTALKVDFEEKNIVFGNLIANYVCDDYVTLQGMMGYSGEKAGFSIDLEGGNINKKDYIIFNDYKSGSTTKYIWKIGEEYETK